MRLLRAANGVMLDIWNGVKAGVLVFADAPVIWLLAGVGIGWWIAQ